MKKLSLLFTIITCLFGCATTLNKSNESANISLNKETGYIGIPISFSYAYNYNLDNELKYAKEKLSRQDYKKLRAFLSRVYIQSYYLKHGYQSTNAQNGLTQQVTVLDFSLSTPRAVKGIWETHDLSFLPKVFLTALMPISIVVDIVSLPVAAIVVPNHKENFSIKIDYKIITPMIEGNDEDTVVERMLINPAHFFTIKEEVPLNIVISCKKTLCEVTRQDGQLISDPLIQKVIISFNISNAEINQLAKDIRAERERIEKAKQLAKQKELEQKRKEEKERKEEELRWAYMNKQCPSLYRNVLFAKQSGDPLAQAQAMQKFMNYRCDYWYQEQMRAASQY